MFDLKKYTKEIVKPLIIAVVIGILILIIFGIDSWLFEFYKIILTAIGMALTFLTFLRAFDVQESTIINNKKERINRDFFTLIDLVNEHSKSLEDETSNSNGGSLTIITFEKIVDLHDNFVEDIQKSAGNNELNERILRQFKMDMARLQFLEMSMFSSYFKTLQCLLSYLNEKLENHDLTIQEYEMYISLVRAQTSEKLIYIIFFSASFSNKYLDLGIELTKSGLFGNTGDFITNKYFPTPLIFVHLLNTQYLFSCNVENNTNIRKKYRHKIKTNHVRTSLFDLSKTSLL